jgi:2-C-methyl-D-erythritol 4-phosphate cytidylyltransferase
MSTAAVIVAAGRGRRAGGDLPKQWRMIHGRTVASYSLATFRAHPEITHIVMVIHPDDADMAQALGVTWVAGGETRRDSVLNGLESLADAGVTRVLIHDVARPGLSAAVIDGVLEALETTEGAAPALPVVDALWVGGDGMVAGTRSREGLFRAQTPQGFHFAPLLAAHRVHQGDAADDVEIARAAGMQVRMTLGSEDNFKITLPADFDRAARLLES